MLQAPSSPPCLQSPSPHRCLVLPAVPGSPFFRTASTPAKRKADSATRGATFYSVLLEFWVTDGDEPVPAAPGTTPAAVAPGAPMW